LRSGMGSSVPNPKETIFFQLQEFEEFRNPSFK